MSFVIVFDQRFEGAMVGRGLHLYQNRGWAQHSKLISHWFRLPPRDRSAKHDYR